ncbi:MAG TPA: DedA family protein [Devosiaceae bacterium]|jgi:membrane protein DedA with SNARE-associated domain
MSDWIIGFITAQGYLGIFLMMVLENVFPPIPSELIMPFAGFAAARGDLNFWGVMLAGVAGSLVGTLPWYIAARLLGIARLKFLADKFGRIATVSAGDIDEADAWFGRYGRWAVLFGRLIPAIRTLISIPAGLAAMPLGLFLIASTIGTVAWTLILTGAGYVLYDHYDAVEGYVDPVTKIVVVALVAVYLYRFVTWKRSAAR